MQSSVSQHRPSQRERESGQSGKDAFHAYSSTASSSSAQKKRGVFGGTRLHAYPPDSCGRGGVGAGAGGRVDRRLA